MTPTGRTSATALVVFAMFTGSAVSRTPSGHLVLSGVLLGVALQAAALTSESLPEPLIPFTLTSITFAVKFVASPESVRHSTVEALSGNNRHIRLDLSFEHLDDLQPKAAQTSVDEPGGLRTSTYWSASRELLKKGMLVVHTIPGYPPHALSANNCVASPRQQWVRLETLTIGGQQFQTSVISNVSETAASTEWRALLPGLSCLMLKRVSSHTNEGGGKTITEPLSLVLAEPDSALFTKFDAEAATSEDVGTLRAFELALSEQGKEAAEAGKISGHR
jgi:hypothetical protein